MKYRRLTKEELAGLETDFVRFLAANTVTADDWQQLKIKQPERAEQLVELFSDIIFTQTFEKAEYLEFKTPKDIKTFHFQKEEIVMNGLRVKGESKLDFTRDINSEQMLGLMKMSEANLQLYTARKKYHQDRSHEMFIMMENGALISPDGALFKTLEQLKK